MDLNEKHPVSKTSRTVQRRKCWWVYFDVDGYAPSDVDIVACATKELAEEVKGWFKRMKDDECEPYAVLNGKKYSELSRHGVDGYMWACCYRIRGGETDDDQIHTSLASVIEHGGIFDYTEKTEEVDGIYFPGAEDEAGEGEGGG